MVTQTTARIEPYGVGWKSREALEQHQWKSLRSYLELLFERNAFYRKKWQAAGINDVREIASLADFQCLPITTRDELARDQEEQPPFGENLTWPPESYLRWFRTSGTRHKPLSVLLTREDRDEMARNWANLFSNAHMKPGDSIYLPFSFGPFIAFWTTLAAAEMFGILVYPGGGASTLERLRFIMQYRPTAIACLPSYALRMAEVARENGIDVRAAGVRVIYTAGEPGPGSVPALRQRIEELWGAATYESYGLSETGTIGQECLAQNGFHLVEYQSYFELLKPGSTQPAAAGEIGELVATPFHRTGMPVVRYRTGDLVRLAQEPCRCGRITARAAGGVLGRADGMIVVRGINVYPTFVENCLLSYPEVTEYQVEIFERMGMKEMRVRVEPAPGGAAAETDRRQLALHIAQTLHQHLTLRVDVEIVPPGSLPRWEGKARRFVQTPTTVSQT